MASAGRWKTAAVMESVFPFTISHLPPERGFPHPGPLTRALTVPSARCALSLRIPAAKSRPSTATGSLRPVTDSAEAPSGALRTVAIAAAGMATHLRAAAKGIVPVAAAILSDGEFRNLSNLFLPFGPRQRCADQSSMERAVIGWRPRLFDRLLRFGDLGLLHVRFFGPMDLGQWSLRGHGDRGGCGRASSPARSFPR